jgi:hypothetical protein
MKRHRALPSGLISSWSVIHRTPIGSSNGTRSSLLGLSPKTSFDAQAAF